MKTTAISLQQQETFYTKLVQDFMVNEKLTADESEKKKFIMLCAVNGLDPRKKQVYAVPHTDSQSGKKTLTLIVDYHQFIERAEQSGKLSGWTVGMKKDDKGGIKSGFIKITRKDRKDPFYYEADFNDLKPSQDYMRKKMPEAMMRKQLIRIGFSLAFPANCATLIDEPEVTTFEEAEQITPDQPVAHAPDIDINLMKQLQDAEIIQPVENTDGGAEDIIGKPQSNIPPSQDPLYNDVKPVPTAQTTPITNDQIGIIKQLSQYLPEGDDIQAPDYYVQAEEMIYKMKCEIGEMVVKKKSLKLNEDEIKQVFSGDNKFIVAIRKAALQALVDNKKK